MENYEVMAISEILYHLYDTADFMQRQQQVLSMTRRFLSCSFASILHAGEPKPDGRPSFCRPVCDPALFLPAEENYIRLSGEDHLLWGSEAGRPGILRESSLLSDEKRLSTPIYKACYEPFQVYDTRRTCSRAIHFLEYSPFTARSKRARSRMRMSLRCRCCPAI